MYTGASTNSEREKGRRTLTTMLGRTIRGTAMTKTERSTLAPEVGVRWGSITKTGG